VISGLAQLAIGAYFGILIESRYLPNLYWKNMLKTGWAKSIFRILATLLLLVPFGVINLVTPQTAPIGVLIVFYTNIPCLGMFACLFAGYDWINGRFKLMNKEISSTSISHMMTDEV
jgi:hypothetical protein